MKYALLGLLVVGTLAGCDRLKRTDDRLRFDGQFFRAAAKSDRDDRAGFVATARPASASLAGAAAAAQHEATRHCLRFFGTSEIVWTVGPDSIEDAPQLDGDSLVLSGSCVDVQG